MGMLLRRHYEDNAPAAKAQPEPAPAPEKEKEEAKGVKSNAVHAGKHSRKA